MSRLSIMELSATLQAIVKVIDGDQTDAWTDKEWAALASAVEKVRQQLAARRRDTRKRA
jgi:hypothetical protein